MRSRFQRISILRSISNLLYVEKFDDQIHSLLNIVSQFYIISRFSVACGADKQYRKIEIWLYYLFLLGLRTSPNLRDEKSPRIRMPKVSQILRNRPDHRMGDRMQPRLWRKVSHGLRDTLQFGHAMRHVVSDCL